MSLMERISHEIFGRYDKEAERTKLMQRVEQNGGSYYKPGVFEDGNNRHIIDNCKETLQLI